MTQVTIRLGAVFALMGFSVLAHAGAFPDFQSCANIKGDTSKAQVAADNKDPQNPKASLLYDVSKWVGDPDSFTQQRITIALQTMINNVYLPDIKSAGQGWEALNRCFVAVGSGSASQDCVTKTNAIAAAYGAFIGSLRQDLALTNIQLDGSGVNGKFKQPMTMNAGKLTGWLPHPFPDAVRSELFSTEEDAANRNLKLSAKDYTHIRQRETQAGNQYITDMMAGLQKNQLYLITSLPAPSGADKNGIPIWSWQQWRDVTQMMVGYAHAEYKRAKAASDSAYLNHAYVLTSMEFWTDPSTKRDLLYYAGLHTEMEKFLQSYPMDCGEAEAALSWVSAQHVTTFLFQMGSMFVAGGGFGFFAKLEELGSVGKVAAYAGKGISLIGGAPGAAVMITQYNQVSADASDALHQEEAAPGTITPEEYQSAQKAASTWIATTAVYTAAGGVVFAGGGYLLGQKLAPWAVKTAAPMIAKIWTKTGTDIRSFVNQMFMTMPKADATQALTDIRNSATGTLAKNVADNTSEAEAAIALGEKVRPVRDEIVSNGDVQPNQMSDVDNATLERNNENIKSCIANGGDAMACRDTIAPKETSDELDQARNQCSGT